MVSCGSRIFFDHLQSLYACPVVSNTTFQTKDSLNALLLSNHKRHCCMTADDSLECVCHFLPRNDIWYSVGNIGMNFVNHSTINRAIFRTYGTFIVSRSACMMCDIQSPQILRSTLPIWFHQQSQTIPFDPQAWSPWLKSGKMCVHIYAYRYVQQEMSYYLVVNFQGSWHLTT